MKEDNSDITLIERFQNGELTITEHKAFNQRLLEDKAFAETVQLQLNITEEIDTFWTNDMVMKIENWEKEIQRNNTKTPVISIHKSKTVIPEKTKLSDNVSTVIPIKKRNYWIKYIAVAAVLLICIVVGLQLLNEEEPDLFAENFEPYPNVITNRGDEESDLFRIGMGAYNEEKYSVALKTIQRYLNKVDDISITNRNAAEFYLAISNLGAGNTNTAIRQFEQIGSNENSVFQKQADWYMALAFVKNNNIEKAKIQLQKIQSDSNSDYKDKASKLFKLL